MRIVAFWLFLSLGMIAGAQNSLTWVSGVGDDLGAGDRTAPCKTFAGAISKTMTGGEIDALDSGGFGAVSINKSITIDGKTFMSSILSAGTQGISVNASNGVVILRNLYLNCTATGTYGIRIVSAGMVRVENCVIFGGTTNAVDFQPGETNAILYITDSHIHDSGGTAVFANPATGGSVVIENSILENCGAGVKAAAGTVQLINCTITDNKGAGLATSGAGVISTHNDNFIFNNHPDGSASGAMPMR